VPRDEDEQSLLERILDSVEWMHRHAHSDLGLYHSEKTAWDRGSAPADVDLFIRQVPPDARRYLHSLVEAVEIYESIHRTPLRGSNPNWSESSLQELRQIRDFCLQDGVRGFF
jgi:hypothetical protein